MNKSQKIESQLRQNILHGLWRTGDRLPSEEMLCNQYGVSRTTVRSALNSLRSAGLLTDGPRRSTVICRPPEGRRTLHIIIKDVHRPLDNMFMQHAFLHEHSGCNYGIALHATGSHAQKEEEILNTVAASPDAFAITTTACSAAGINIIAANPDRIAVFGNIPQLSGRCIQACSDIWQGAEMMMNHLRRCGHRHIAFFGEQADGKLYMVWKNKLAANGIYDTDDLAVAAEDDLYSDHKRAIQLANSFLRHIKRLKEPPTAVFCSSDFFANLLRHAALANNIAVPEELSIAGFGGWGNIYGYPGFADMTTIIQPFGKIFSALFNALVDYHGENTRILINPDLYKGNTVTKVNH